MMTRTMSESSEMHLCLIKWKLKWMRGSLPKKGNEPGKYGMSRRGFNNSEQFLSGVWFIFLQMREYIYCLS